MFGLFKKTTQPEIQPQSTVTPNQALQAIAQMQKELDKLKIALTSGDLTMPVLENNNHSQGFEDSMNEIQDRADQVVRSEAEKVVEGVFDGQIMIGSDGQQYDVPANYASKSKLVEGDILKLMVNNLGAFVYKQIKPIERERKVGKLYQDPQSLQFYAVEGNKKWKLLTASVTYFKGEDEDEVVFLIPEEGGSKWAAVENIVKE